MPVSFDTPITTSDQSVDRVLNAGLPVLLVLQDGSPQPALEQTLNRIAGENAGKLLVARVRIDENPETARRFGLSRAPAVIALREGRVLAKSQAISPRDVEKYAAFLLGKGPVPETPAPQPGYTAPRQPAAGAAAGHPQKVTDATFDRDVLQSTEPVLVDFWAPWCGPCRIVEPVVEKMASELTGRLKVAKVNVDENPIVSQRFGVMSIPTMMVVKNGKIIDRWAGALPEQALRTRVAASLGKG